MIPTELFVYGTLRHDQPEHAKYCRGVTGWETARARGRLFRLVEGYLLLVVPPAAILLRATDDAAADESMRRAISQERLAAASQELDHGEGARWIHGERLVFSDAATAWPPLDHWEGTSTRENPVYARVVVAVPAGVADGRLTATWVYAATRPPLGAVELLPGQV